MTTETAWKDIQEKHEMAYFKGQLATEFPESYSIEEMREIGDGMFASTTEVDAMLRADFESLPPFAQDKMLGTLREAMPVQLQATDLLQEPLAQVLVVVCEHLVGIVLQPIRELEVEEGEAAEHVRNLAEPVLPVTHARLELYRAFRQAFVERVSHSPRNGLLAVVVVYLHALELLEVLQVIVQHGLDVLLHAIAEALRNHVRIGVLVAKPVLLLLVEEGLVDDRAPYRELVEVREHLRAILDGDVAIVVLPAHERTHVERYVVQLRIAQARLVGGDVRRYGIALVVKDEREQVVIGIGASVTRFVDEDAVFQTYLPLQKKRAEIPPPDFDGPNSEEPTHVLYTMQKQSWEAIS